jgi:hypothetical protein
MTPETASATGSDLAQDGRCWCCGSPFPETRLVRLGDHPEVGVCFDCALFLRRRAVESQDRLAPTAASRTRSVIRTVRDQVIERDWHNRRVLGRALRWIDRRLP